MNMLPRMLAIVAGVAWVGLVAQTPDPGPYLAQQPEIQIPSRPPKNDAMGDKLAQEERDARFLMDLQIANQVRAAQSSENVRQNQEKASAALLEYYTRLMQPQADTVTPPVPGSASTVAPTPVTAKPVSSPAAEAAAAEDGPTLARKRGLGYIPKGTIIDIRLYTQVNTSIPGPVIGEVIYDVYDVDMRYILIPRGTKVTGAAAQMGSDTEAGGKVVMDTFIDPGGREIPIAVPVITASRLGVTGIPGRVDYHWGRVFGGSAALAVLTAFSSGNQPAGANSTMTQADLMRQNLVSQTGQLGNSYLNRFTQIKPDVTLEEGSSAKVIIIQHMMVRPYQKVF